MHSLERAVVQFGSSFDMEGNLLVLCHDYRIGRERALQHHLASDMNKVERSCFLEL